jgi:hypothetical protein
MEVFLDKMKKMRNPNVITYEEYIDKIDQKIREINQ